MAGDADSAGGDPRHRGQDLLAQLDAILGCIAEGVVVYDLDGRILRSNAAANALLGYTAGELDASIEERLASGRFEWLAEDGRRLALEDTPAYRAARLGETHRGVPLRMRSAGGERWFTLTAVPLVAGDERIGAVVSFSEMTDRMRAEQLLGDALTSAELERSRLSAVLDALPAGVAIADANGGIIRFNEALVRIWGGPPIPRKAEEYREWRARWVATGEPVQPGEWAMERALFGGETVHGDVLDIERFDGSGRAFILNEAAPIRNADGRVVGGVVTAVDITAQRRAEEELRRAEREYRTLAENAPEVIARFDTQLRHTYVNEYGAKVYGVPARDVIGKTNAELGMPADKVAFWRRHFEEVLATGEQRTVEFEFDSPTFGTQCFSSLFVPERDERAAVRSVLAITRDVTAAKRAEEELRESEERYRTLFTNMTEGFALGEVICDPAGKPSDFRLIEMNAAFERQTGLVRENLRGRSIREVLPHVEQYWVDTYGAIALGAPARRFEMYNRDLQRHFSVYCFSPSHGRFAIAFTDVTERRNAEQALHAANERLREADRRKDEFLGMLSHELRNPLAPIRNALFILDRAEPGSPQARRAKEVANRQIAHITRLVDDLLDVTRIARGKIELRRADVDVAELARRAAEDHRTLMQDRGLELVLELPQGPVVVNGDETRLAQVLGNLLNNAAKFTPEGGRVTLAVHREGANAAISVRDTGVGIEAELLPSVFEAFTQAKQTLARSEGGLGLGLALVKGLVLLHGGDVTASSGGGGRGTEFVVTIPLAASAHAADAAVGPGTDGGRAAARRRRVLVVDDNRDAAETLAQLVEMLGHEVDVAYDGPSALKRAAERRPELVLCDIGLPGMDGYEVARRLRAEAGAEVRLVALSGYAQPEDVALALEAGFDQHVAKPPDPRKLAGILD